MLPAPWRALLATDRGICDGDVLATRGECTDILDGTFALGAVWVAVVPPDGTVRWRPHTAGASLTTRAPKPRMIKGEGPAGAPAPEHPPTQRVRVLFTDGGCVHNSLVGTGQQLAGAGCVVLNGTRADATAAAVSIFCPVDIDPHSRYFLGATRGTNNTGELQGVCEALLWLRDHDDDNTADVYIYVDSKYAPAVVEARWGFSSNIALTLTAQAVLVQVRAHRNVHFRWVHGHSGDVWNDAADEMATVGQDPSVSIRTGCVEGRYAPDAPRTLLDYDPRHDGTEYGLHTDGVARSDLTACVSAAEAPRLDTLRRVTCADGSPLGFSDQVFASQISRVTWDCGASDTTRAQFSVKAVRRALQANCANTAGDLHVHAARVAAASPPRPRDTVEVHVARRLVCTMAHPRHRHVVAHGRRCPVRLPPASPP
jgi:ribonuclease HI